jgi:NAD-dependent SIR2 family protein deacetylase
MKNDTIIKCGCCGDDTPESKASRDAETNDIVCPDCKTGMRNAKAILGMPFDSEGRPINIKGCYQQNDAPDNL